jgi:hypothetical protein
MGFNRGTQNMDYTVLQNEKKSSGTFASRSHGSLYWNRVKPYGSRAYEGSDNRLLKEYQIGGYIRLKVVYKGAAPGQATTVYEKIHGAPKTAIKPKAKASRVDKQWQQQPQQRHPSAVAGASLPSKCGYKSVRTPSAEKKTTVETKKPAVFIKPSGVKNAAVVKKTLGVKDAGVKETSAVKKNKVVPKKSTFLLVLEEVANSSTS